MYYDWKRTARPEEDRPKEGFKFIWIIEIKYNKNKVDEVHYNEGIKRKKVNYRESTVCEIQRKYVKRK